MKSLIKYLFLSMITANSAFGVSLFEIPNIKNKTPITIALEKGLWETHLKTNIIPEFEKTTGVKVTAKLMNFSELYKSQLNSLDNAKGEYDLLNIDAKSAKHFAANGYTIPLNEVANLHDNHGEEGLNQFLTNFYPTLLSIFSYKKHQHAIPHNNYIMGNHYRKDLFESEIEKSDFLSQYGYSLAPPKTAQQLLDVAKFFKRKKGERLKNEILQHDFYGLTLMAGNKPDIKNELSSILWGIGGTWFKPIYNGFKNIQEFQVKLDNKELKYATETYIELKKYSYPTDDNFAYLEAATALNSGYVAMWPFAYNNMWPISAQVEKKINEAKIAITEVPLGKPYIDAHAFAIAYDSKNIEASFWLLKYLTSFGVQLAYALNAGNPCRQDVILEDRFSLSKNHLTTGYFIQNHKSNSKYATDISNYGYFSSSVMDKISQELIKASFKITFQPDSMDTSINNLGYTIFNLQNTYGEIPATMRKEN